MQSILIPQTSFMIFSKINQKHNTWPYFSHYWTYDAFIMWHFSSILFWKCNTSMKIVIDQYAKEHTNIPLELHLVCYF